MALRRRAFVPSTARFLFGGTKRKCGVGTVGSKSFHALTGRGQYAPSTRNRYLLYALVFFVGPCGAVLSLVGKYPKDGKRGVSNPPSCNSPQRLLKRRRARYSVQFGKPNDHKIFILFHIVSALWDCGKTRYGREWTPKRSVRRRWAGSAGCRSGPKLQAIPESAAHKWCPGGRMPKR